MIPGSMMRVLLVPSPEQSSFWPENPAEFRHPPAADTLVFKGYFDYVLSALSYCISTRRLGTGRRLADQRGNDTVFLPHKRQRLYLTTFNYIVDEPITPLCVSIGGVQYHRRRRTTRRPTKLSTSPSYSNTVRQRY